MRFGVCSYCQTGGKELTSDGLIAPHHFLHTNMDCDGGFTTPETTYTPKGILGRGESPHLPATNPPKPFSFGTFGDLLKKMPPKESRK